MKAKIKATGEIVHVGDYNTIHHDPMYKNEETGPWRLEELDFAETPDYWTRLEHQYAGMAMQGISGKYLQEYRDYCLGRGDMDEDEAKATMKDFANAMADVCNYFAHALVEKLKEKEERK